MKSVFYIIRHGETDWNVQRRLQGHSDIPLNTKGQEQALSLSQRFVPKIDLVISSDLIRAQQTGARIFPSLKMQTTEKIREAHLGQAEGLTKEQVIANWGEVHFEEWTSQHPQFLDHRFPSGESKRELLQRMKAGLQAHLNENPDKTLAFISHGLAMRTLIHHLNPERQEIQMIDNCGVLKLERSPEGLLSLIEYFDSTRTIA
jgi:probable phosphoglycerate mutase